MRRDTREGSGEALLEQRMSSPPTFDRELEFSQRESTGIAVSRSIELGK